MSVRTPSQSRFEKIAILAMSAAFLLLVVALLLLVGSGKINLGLDPSLAFLTYVVAGLLVAFATFGILTSTGELSGSPFGVRARLGGSLVAAVVIAAGGGIFEYYVRPSAFSTRVVFYEKTAANPVELVGSFAIIVGAAKRTEPILPDGTVLFQGLPKREEVRYFLRSPEFEIAPTEKEVIPLSPESVVFLKVVRKEAFEPYESSNINIEFTDAFLNRAVGNSYSLVAHLTAWNRGERPVPLRGVADLKLSKSGLERQSYTGEVTSSLASDIITLKPGSATPLIFNVEMPSDFDRLVHMGFDAAFVLKYADLKKVDGGDYTATFVPFNEATFPIQ